MKSSRFFAAAAMMSAALGIVASAKAQDAVEWRQSPIIFLPGEAEAGEGDFVQGDPLVTFPLRWALSTRLVEDVVISAEGEEIVLGQGELLPRVVLKEGDQLQRERMIFCTRSRVAESLESSGFLGMMGGPLFNSLRDGQTCLEDTDHDGYLDHALALGEGDEILDLGTVSKLAYEELLAEPINPTRDYAQISLGNIGSRRITLNFRVYQRGNRRNFDSLRSGGFYAQGSNRFRYGDGESNMLPLLGMLFVVGSADRKEKRASFTWNSRVGLDTFIVIPNIVTARYGW